MIRGPTLLFSFFLVRHLCPSSTNFVKRQTVGIVVVSEALAICYGELSK
jgi:hypothetical protein